MKDIFTGVNAHHNVLVRIKQIENDPTKVFVARGKDGDVFWVEWRTNHELRVNIAQIIASRQMTRSGIESAADEIFEMLKTGR